ncbi:Crp/Fnr family transcriptional regulator [Leptolyngbya sp. GB1-A1]|uniref:Crp/Fnr family transcriptional regulator n=1 Tax=unclassified Leptolyngbya TaxID=2650499 RepID=UPI0019B63F24|nr:Crp/Fnr family transcriptional regulator [Cyanobacteria bacterium FACHB-502]
MGKRTERNLLDILVQQNYLFKNLDKKWLAAHLPVETLVAEKIYSNRLVYTAFRPDSYIEVLYLILEGGPVIIRSAPLDRIIALSYPGGCFGMRSLPVGYGSAGYAFPSQVEAYKTTSVIKIPLTVLQQIYETNETFRSRYDKLFELREKFQYHLLNCSTYPPQAVASLLRALVYQERSLGNQPNGEGIYTFDLPIDIIARACQLNHRTVEQVIKGMHKVGLVEPTKDSDTSNDILRVIDAEGLKETYSATRDKVSWWPLK